MVLGISELGHPTNFLVIAGKRPAVLAVVARGVVMTLLSCLSYLFSLFLSLGDGSM